MGAPSTAATCPQCGTRLSASLGEDLCPHCLFGLALSSSDEVRLGVDAEAPTTDLPPGTLAPGAVLGERYRIRKLLGRGGMGEVWRAYDLKLRVDVALKSLHVQWLSNERMLESLRQEVRSARQVISPNVCRVFDLVELDGSELVTMEYVDGQTLLGVLAERGPLELEEARGLASQLLAGLESIHDAGLVHRDLKPENIMLTRAGRVVIMDFGIAKGLAEGQTGTVAGTPAYMAPEQVHGGGGDARADLYSVGVVLAEMVSPGGLSTLPAREAVWQGVHHDPPQVAETPWAGVIRKAVARSPEQRWPSASALARALEEVTLRVAGAETLHPYPGLSSFTAHDAEYFFGREYEIEAVWKKLRQAHLLALIGPSGAGKSSFLRAGLLPAMPPGWAAIVATPGTRSFTALAEALASELTGDSEAVRSLPRFDDPDVAVSLIARWRQRHEQALVVVDQFEELFTLNPPEAQQRFAELLSRLALEADARVVVSMRDDFLFRCHDHEALAPLFSELTPLGPPTGAALRRAVVQPALKCGYRFEDDALVDDMLREVEGERGALPMLAFAAAQLWARRGREKGLLTREAYEQIGGVAGALAQHAEATLERIGQERVPLVRELFRNLVTAQGTRAVRDRDELLSVFAADSEREHAGAVLDALIDARLLTSYDIPADDEKRRERHRIEIVHESLLSNWPRLVRWQTQDADGAQLRDQVRQAAQMWEQRSRSEDLLWTGTAFQEFQLWRERYPGGLSEQEEAFARAMQVTATRRRRQKRLAVAALFALLLGVAATLTGFWLRSESARVKAVAAEEQAMAKSLWSLARLQPEEQPTAFLAYATASLEHADHPELRRQIVRALWRGPVEMRLPGVGGGTAYGVLDFSPDGRWLATAGGGGISLWPANGGPPKRLTGSRNSVIVQVSPAGNTVACSGQTPDPDGNGVQREIHLWSLPAGELLRTLSFDETTSWFRYSADGTRLFTFSEEGIDQQVRYTIRSWPVAGGEARLLGQLDLPPGYWPAIDPTGQRLAWTDGPKIRLGVLDGTGGAVSPTESLELDSVPVWATFDETGRNLAAFDDEGTVRVWSLDQTPPKLLRVVTGGRKGGFLDLERPSSWIAQAGLAWSPGAPAEAEPLHVAAASGAFVAGAEAPLAPGGTPALHPRGDWLATGGPDAVSFWPLTQPRATVLRGHEGRVLRVEFTPDGRRLLSSSEDGTVRIWPLTPNRGERARVLYRVDGEEAVPSRLAVSPEGTFAVAGVSDGRVVVLPLDGGPARLLRGFSTEGAGLAVGPRGRLVAASGGLQSGQQQLYPIRDEAVVRIWDLESGQTRVLDVTRTNAIGGLRFTPEGDLWVDTDTAYERFRPDQAEPRPLEVVADLSGPQEESWRVQTVDPIARRILFLRWAGGRVAELWLHDLSGGGTRKLAAQGADLVVATLDPSGRVVVSADRSGLIRVGPVDGGEPHLLFGHRSAVLALAVSPDGKWIASAGADRTLRVWPMPDLSQAPLHTLPRAELVAKLKSLTNLRAVPAPGTAEGWRLEVGPFPGWEEVPAW